VPFNINSTPTFLEMQDNALHVLAEGLPHLGKGLPVLPALESLTPHSHSIERLYASGS
jgi:hypothetical protein